MHDAARRRFLAAGAGLAAAFVWAPGQPARRAGGTRLGGPG